MAESEQKKDTQSRAYNIVVNNPLNKNLDRDKLREIILSIPNLMYACLCDEIGENNTPHVHIYLKARNPIKFSTMCNKFNGQAHVESAKGTPQQNRDYVRKEGAYLDSEKKETNLIQTFEEFGTLPHPVQGKRSDLDLLLQMINEGYTNAEIITERPQFIMYLNHIERTRQALREDEFRNVWRDITCVYIYGETNTNKTRSVMDKYGYENVYRITNYSGNAIWDGYRSQDVVIFEEYRSQILISELLTWLEGYPNVSLRARYSDKVACFTKIFMISNIPLDEQYPNVQTESPATWRAFLRRISKVYYHKDKKTIIEYNSVSEYLKRNENFQPLDDTVKTPFDDTDEPEQLSMPFD